MLLSKLDNICIPIHYDLFINPSIITNSFKG